MRGHKPMPYEIAVLKNKKNRVTKAKLEQRKENQPTIKSNELICPEHLEPNVKKEWDRIIKLYGEIDQLLITDLDSNALEVYCESMITYRKAMKKIRDTSEVFKSNNDPKINPWVRVANEAATLVKKYGEILLLDPVSRARVSMVEKEKPFNPMEVEYGL